MKSFSWILFLIIVSVSFSACTKKLRGSGDYITQQRDLLPFESIESNGGFDVYIIHSNTPGVSITAEDNIINEIETIVRDGKLRIRFRRNVNVTHGNITITASAGKLKHLSVLGSGYIRPAGEWKVDELYCSIAGSGDIIGWFDAVRLRVEISGSGSFNGAGISERSDFTISGSGNIHAFQSSARGVQVSVTGSGNCEVSVSRKLHASIGGSGKVRYKGEPSEFSQHITGSGRVEKQ